MLFILIFSIFSSHSNAEPRPFARQTLSKTYKVRAGNLVRVAFFDADSTLRVSRSGKVSANSEKDVMILPCVATRLADLTREGYLIAIVSNQGGVSAGFITEETADEALKFTMDQLIDAHKWVRFHYYDFAPNRDHFRKPNTGMIDLLVTKLDRLGLSIDKDHSFVVGDSLFKKKAGDLKPNCEPGEQFSNSDRGLAENFGIRFFDPADFFGWKDLSPKLSVFSHLDQLSLVPEKALGTKRNSYCRSLPSFVRYQQSIQSGSPTRKWLADYQCLDADFSRCVSMEESHSCAN